MAGIRKYISAQESFYLQGILNDINEQDTSFLDYKHKHKIKCGALPDKFRVLTIYLPMEFHGFTCRINFLETVWVPLIMLQ